jgi:hypothetical protein
MKTGLRSKPDPNDRGVANMIEYVMISGVCTALLIVMMLLVNSYLLEAPADQLSYVAFVDVGNGVSTRIVDVYALAPVEGTITTKIDLPQQIAEKDYNIDIGPGADPADEDVVVSRGYISTNVALAGIGASRGVEGNTTGTGMKKISYDSRGF